MGNALQGMRTIARSARSSRHTLNFQNLHCMEYRYEFANIHGRCNYKIHWCVIPIFTSCSIQWIDWVISLESLLTCCSTCAFSLALSISKTNNSCVNRSKSLYKHSFRLIKKYFAELRSISCPVYCLLSMKPFFSEVGPTTYRQSVTLWRKFRIVCLFIMKRIHRWRLFQDIWIKSTGRTFRL